MLKSLVPKSSNALLILCPTFNYQFISNRIGPFVCPQISPERLDQWSWNFMCVIYTWYGRNLRKKLKKKFSKFSIFEISTIFSRFLSKLRSSDIFPSNCSVIGKCKQSANFTSNLNRLKLFFTFVRKVMEICGNWYTI